MAHSYTNYLKLLKIDPDVEMSKSDFLQFFQRDKETIDAQLEAANHLIEAVAANGYVTSLPVNVADSVMKIRIENAATGYFNLPTLLASLPEHTPVRITGFVLSMSAERDVDEFYDVLDKLYGLDASGNGVTKAQMNGVIDLGTREITGDMVRAWRGRYPDIAVTSKEITNKLFFFNFDGSEKFYEETVFLNRDGAWSPSAERTARTDHPEGYYYVFDGWSLTANTVVDAGNGAKAGNPDLLKNVAENRILYAAYLKYPRTGPSFTVIQTAAKATDTVIVTIDYLETFEAPTYLLYNKSDGEEVTNKSVSSSGDVILDNQILTVHMSSDLFAAYNHALYFKEPSSAGGRDVSVPLVMTPNKPYLHVERFVSAAGDTAVVKVAHWGSYQRVKALTYKLSGNAEDTVAESPSVTFNVDAENSRFTIRMTSAAMLNATYFAVFEDASGNTENVPLPNLKTVK